MSVIRLEIQSSVKMINKLEESNCIRKKIETQLVFFNISSEYHFCSKKVAHHKRNITFIIIDISNNTYAIRCKDPQYGNTILSWQYIIAFWCFVFFADIRIKKNILSTNNKRGKKKYMNGCLRK
jgi:hypothetical protein